MSINETLTEIVEKSGKQSFGVRVITRNPTEHSPACKIGDTLANSYQWVDGSTTTDQIDGVSAILLGYDGFDVEDIDFDLQRLAPYRALGDQVVLIGGDRSYEGNDASETVISNAEVLYIF